LFFHVRQSVKIFFVETQKLTKPIPSREYNGDNYEKF